MTRRFAHLLPRMRDWPIYKLSESRGAFVGEIVEDMLSAYEEVDAERLLDDLTQVIKAEFGRIRHHPWNVDPPNEKAFWKKVESDLKEVRHKDEVVRHDEAMRILKRIVQVYAEEIAGRFRPWVFQFARYFCSTFFTILFNRFITRGVPFWGGTRALDKRIKVVGHIEDVRALFDDNIVVMVPTHSSNLDSLFLGYVMDRYVGLPSTHYGAGLNLYNNELAGYFMNRLGAYRVDRRKKNKIYLDTLKSASRMSLIRGVNSLFFPGGTRSRSGGLETQLKMGLLGSTVEAQRAFVEMEDYKRICIVPVVLSYSKVLEDTELMRDHMKKAGMGRDYSSAIKKATGLRRSWSIVSSVFGGQINAYVSIGRPLDVFGNELDGVGRSMDESGQHIHKRDYFMSAGAVSADAQRERQYTRHLADRVAESYTRHTVVQAHHVVCYAWLLELMSSARVEQVEELLRLPKASWSVSWDDLSSRIQQVQRVFTTRAERGAVMIASDWPGDDATHWFDLSRQYVRSYSSARVLWRGDDRVYSDHLGIILFYAERLMHDAPDRVR